MGYGALFGFAPYVPDFDSEELSSFKYCGGLPSSEVVRHNHGIAFPLSEDVSTRGEGRYF